MTRRLRIEFSGAINVTVGANQSPTVLITAPANNASYGAPATITLNATASDGDGSISKVEFYNGTTLLSTVTAAPYGYSWSNVPAGSYSLSARAYDNWGASTLSAAVAVTVTAGVAHGVYYVYADQLNTPRVITDSANKVVWRWDSDPFGSDAANEDPDGDGVRFAYNLRFPGQYFDQETGLHYNYFRDYDPTIGRYVEPDPIGLNGGSFSIYAYVKGNPATFVDPLGLSICRGTWFRYKWRLNGPSVGVPVSDGRSPVARIKTIPVLTCTCWWLCEACNAPSLMTPDGSGLPMTSGVVFFDPAGSAAPDTKGSMETGNNCLCAPPGPQTGCPSCEKK
jgi:RHS repeat-associated protein